VLAFKLLSVEWDMLATLDRGASARLAASCALRARHEARTSYGYSYGHPDTATHAPSLRGTV
jgi:hypothetical protein